MGEKRYMISDAAKIVDVEAHVLRYWEEELDIDIPRNEMGHRYYTDTYINLFKQVKDLKDSGFLLKAIKMLLPDLMAGKSVDTISNTTMLQHIDGLQHESLNSEELTELTHSSNSSSSKMELFQALLGDIVSKALVENNDSLGKQVSTQVSDSVIKEMDYLLRMKEEREEERFKRFDEVMRNYQRGQKEAAAAIDKKKHKFFRK